MSFEKFKKLKENDVSKTICGLCLQRGKKKKLYDLCLKYNIPITYPDLFNDDKHYFLWGISERGIGLIGTFIMNYLEENNGIIFKSLDELEEYLINKKKND